MWHKISSRSKKRVTALLTPPTNGVEDSAPRGLTIRALIHHKRHSRLRGSHTVARIEGNHLLSIGNLVKLGFDFHGDRNPVRLRGLAWENRNEPTP